MVKPWDRKMKALFSQAPQDFTEWLLKGAFFNSIVSSELEGETTYTDLLFDVTLNGQKMLLHIEFQRRRDVRMAERLWAYNQKATLKYSCSVWSVVVYLKKDGSVIEAPLQRTLPDGRTVHWFAFEIVKLWEIPVQQLLDSQLPGVLPLLPLTKEGAKREVVEQCISSLLLEAEPKTELLTLAYGLASLAFENEDDQEWLIRRFAKMYDMLRETRAFQEIIKEGLQEGFAKGRQEGVEVGRQEGVEVGRQEGVEVGRQEGVEVGLRNGKIQVLKSMMQLHFPELIQQAIVVAENVKDLHFLDTLIVQISTARTSEEVLQLLKEANTR